MAESASDEPSNNGSTSETYIRRMIGHFRDVPESESGVRSRTIKFSKSLIKDLKARLKNSINNIKDINVTTDSHKYDISKHLQTILCYWLLEYNFKNREKFLNKYPHFITTIEGLAIHFVHMKPNKMKEKCVLPILLLHGWPSSVVEFYEIIPFLTDVSRNTDIVFEVIAPSLPGFGFSNIPSNDQRTCNYISGILVKLMIKLKHDQFYVHCDDWCAVLVHVMTNTYPNNILGAHYGLCQIKEWKNLNQYILEAEKHFRDMPENQARQTTSCDDPFSGSPNIFALGILDSPACLAAFFIDKFLSVSIYSDTFSRLKHYTCTQIIDNLMIYWISRSIRNAMEVHSAYRTVESEELFQSAPVCKTYTATSLFLPHSNPLRSIDEESSDEG